MEGCTDAARSAADIVLLAPGLSTITDGIITSRAIFQRLRSYALYRITSTIHFLLFMFIITLVEDWNMPAVLLIMICVLVRTKKEGAEEDELLVTKRIFAGGG